jgi:23S rRNA pseudouridine1911/1915/1917 synthase
VIHRLDREAEGILVFSKNDEAYRALKRQFFEHSVERIYAALVSGRPKPAKGRIESYLVELPNGSMRNTANPKKGQWAITEYETVSSNGEFSLLRVKLHTGRKHQIRAQLSQRGWPIVGDAMYGPRKQPRLPLMLAATTLALTHPRTGERMRFEIPPQRMSIT